MPPDYDYDQSIVMPNDPVSNVKMILSIVISTIMLLSVGYKDITKDHLRWTLSYLECVKDELGNYPPNVRGIMNHIKVIDDTLESFNETEVDEAVLMDLAAQAIITEQDPNPDPTPNPNPDSKGNTYY